jgi:hypothetical protein
VRLLPLRDSACQKPATSRLSSSRGFFSVNALSRIGVEVMSGDTSFGSDEASARRAPQRAVPSPRGAQPGDAHASQAKRQPESCLSFVGLLTSRPPCNPISYGGEDWVTLSLYVRYRDFDKTAKLLDGHRQAAEERRQGDDELTLAGQTFLAIPAGAKVGSKRGKAYFRWQLQSETGFVLQLMNRPSCKGTMPNGKLVATSLVMIRLGIEAVGRQAFDAICALGGFVERNKVSRVDVCCDLPGRKVEPLKLAYDAGHVVCRADSSDEHAEE